MEQRENERAVSDQKLQEILRFGPKFLHGKEVDVVSATDV